MNVIRPNEKARQSLIGRSELSRVWAVIEAFGGKPKQQSRQATAIHRSRILCAAVLALVANGAAAQALIGIQGSPAAWRVQNYVGSGPQLYFTPSSCAQGSLGFPAGTAVDDLNRFWALLMTAKVTGQDVGIYYYVSGTSCLIESFYLPP